MIVSRRRFLMFAAPAIVSAPALMRISTAFLVPGDEPWDIEAMAAEAERRIVAAIRYGQSGPRQAIHFAARGDGPGFEVSYLPNPWPGMKIKKEEQWL